MNIKTLSEEELIALKKKIDTRLDELSLSSIPKEEMIDICIDAKTVSKGIDIRQEIYPGVYALKTMFLKYFDAENIDDKIECNNKFITIPKEMDKNNLQLSKENKQMILDFKLKCKRLMEKTESLSKKYSVSFGDITLKAARMLGEI